MSDKEDKQLPPWGSQERVNIWPWPVSHDEQISHANFWKALRAKAKSVDKDKGQER